MTDPSRRRGRGRPRRDQPVSEQPTEQLILATATRLFQSHGYRSLTLSQIAQEAGLTKASLYYYFPSKEALFVRAMVEMLDRVARQTRLVLTETPGDLWERLAALALRRLRSLPDALRIEKLLQEAEPYLRPEHHAALHAAYHRVVAVVSGFLAEHLPLAQADDIPLLTYAYLYLLYLGEVRDEAGRPIFPADEATARAIVRLFHHGAEAFAGDHPTSASPPQHT